MAKKLIKSKKATKGKFGTTAGLSGLVETVNQSLETPSFPEFKPGDTVKVHVRIKEGDKSRIQIFEGLVIKDRGQGTDRAFTVRKVSYGVCVERVFSYHSPKIAKVELVQRGKVRRAKLYYIRSLEGRAARIQRDVRAQTKATRT